MPNPSGPDRENTPNPPGLDPNAESLDPAGTDADPVTEQNISADEEATQSNPVAATGPEAATEVITKPEPQQRPDSASTELLQRNRRFTAPGFDAKETAVIQSAAEPATEVFRPAPDATPPPRTAVPQLIPPRFGAKLRPSSQHSWGWVLALILIILALAAIAVLGTLLLTRAKAPKASQEDQVRNTIQSFDVAIQNGDLATLRSITCGTTRDGYVTYDEKAWTDTYRRVAAAKQYPVIASIDQVVVNGEHAEANITTFMANAPQTRSTRSFDLQFRDNQWKICQSAGD